MNWYDRTSGFEVDYFGVERDGSVSTGHFFHGNKLLFIFQHVILNPVFSFPYSQWFQTDVDGKSVARRYRSWNNISYH